MPDRGEESDPVKGTVAAYDATASRYAARWFRFRLETDLDRFARRLGTGARVLDVGCGPGRDVLALQERGLVPVGVDLSWAMLQEARRRVQTPFVQADMRALPFADHSFGGAWVCASLLHLPKHEAPHVLEEIRRVLDHGILYVAVKEGDGEGWVVGEDGRRRFFALYRQAELELLVERSGFEVLEVWTTPDAAGRNQRWIALVAWTRIRTPLTAANAIIFNERGEVLLTRRTDNGQWCLPGGHMDFGESIAQTAVRETREETGLEVEVEHLVGVYSGAVHTSPSGRPRQYLVVTFRCRVVGGQLTVGGETTDVGFFPPEALPEPMFPHHVTRIQDALAGREAAFIR